MLTRDFLSKRFYASLIGPQFSDEEIARLIQTCKDRDYYIAGVAVNLHQISLAASLLTDSGIGLIAAVAYPLGNLPTDLKVIQIKEAIRDGATQIHALMKVGALKVGDYESAEEDAEAIIAACQQIGPSALIAGTAYLDGHQTVAAARISLDVGSDFMTNPGFGPVTKLNDIRLVREEFGEQIQIIASGGCRTAEQAIAFLNIGASRILTSKPFQILDELEALLDIGSNL